MIVFFVAVLFGWVLTALVRQACFKWQVFDLPNSRSAHKSPTPTLGGVALIIGFWALIVVSEMMELSVPEFVYGLLAASVVLCLLIRDEIQEMIWWQKLSVQVVAAIVVVMWGVVFESVSFGEHIFELGNLGGVVTVIFLVALQNLYNFMDGLDGFAALEGVLVSGILVALFWVAAPDVSYFLLGVCGVTLGFWFWNKPPARIFMGDVGAHFLPLCFGVVAIVGHAMGGIRFWMVMLPLGTFLFDAGYTLIRRLLRHENITQAHRFHLYQRLQLLGWRDWAINGIYGLFTILLGGGVLLCHFGWVSVGYCVLGGALVMMGIGTLCLEKRYLNTESDKQI